MAIVFLKEKKKQKYLLLILILIIILVWLVARQGFFAKPTVPLTFSKPPEVKINFSALDSPLLKELETFLGIKPFQGELGRENPFVPYSKP